MSIVDREPLELVLESPAATPSPGAGYLVGLPTRQRRLDGMVLNLLPRLWDWCAEVAEVVYSYQDWILTIRPRAATEMVRLHFDDLGGETFGLCVTRGLSTELYRFRNEYELAQIVPAGRERFAERWQTAELTFAATLPNSISAAHGGSVPTR